MFTEPRVSTAGSFFTIALILDIRVTPIAKTIATIAGNPSGIAATAKLIAVRNISNKSLFWINEIANIKIHIPIAM